jgi:hypothetical protein
LIDILARGRLILYFDFMNFRDRLRPGKFVDRLRPWFFLIALAFGFALIKILTPLDFHDGVGLIIYGAIVGAWNDQRNPSVEIEDVGPLIPWDKMHAGDRLEYFFHPLSVTVLGLLFVAVSVLSFGSLAENWIGLLGGLVIVLGGLGTGYRKWIRRYGAVESE